MWYLPPGACPTCCWGCWGTCEVVYASVLSVVFGFNLPCTNLVNTCTYMVLRLIVGWVFTGCMGCCILFLGSAIGCWLFAVTVYWMFGSVAWLLVGWWPSGWMWVMRCLLVGFFFFWATAQCMCMTQPLSRCGGVCNPCVLDRFFDIVCVLWHSLIHCCPGSVRVTGYI